MIFESEVKEQLAVFSCKSSLEKEECEPAIKELAKFLESDAGLACKGIVIDLQGQFKIGEQFLRDIMPIVNTLRGQKKRVFMIHVEEAVENFIVLRGMDTAVKVFPDFQSVRIFVDPSSANKPNRKIDVEFINPFIEATINTLTVQCGVEEVTPGRPAMVEGKIDGFTSGIVAIIGLRSDRFSGAVAVCFPEKVFLGIISKMLMEEYTELTKEVEDGAGEIVNIILGQAKAALNEVGHKIERAIPTIVSGKNIAVTHFTPAPSFYVPFETEVGKFWIEIGRGS